MDEFWCEDAVSMVHWCVNYGQTDDDDGLVDNCDFSNSASVNLKHQVCDLLDIQLQSKHIGVCISY